MIDNKVHEALYRKYKKLPESPDFLDMPLLFEAASKHHGVNVDMEGPVDALVLNSIEPTSPFHRIPLERIHAIVPFEEWVAIVLHSSIIYLHKNSPEVKVHLKALEPSVMDRIRGLFVKD